MARAISWLSARESQGRLPAARACVQDSRLPTLRAARPASTMRTSVRSLMAPRAEGPKAYPNAVREQHSHIRQPGSSHEFQMCRLAVDATDARFP